MAGKRILLIEPGYKNKYPSLGLMKIVQYHGPNGKNDHVTFVKGEDGSGVRDRAAAQGTGSCADGARYLEKSRRHLCGDATVKFAFIEQHASTWPVNVLCRMLGVSRSGYYDWCGRSPSARTTANLALLDDVRRLEARH